MTLAFLHRRLAAGMGLAALLAFAAGAGFSPGVMLGMAGLTVALFWLPSPEASVWVERASRVGVVALCGWMLYVAFVLVEDFMPAVLGMLLFLLVAESLRSVDARNDMRLYSLSFALLIAATAYYPGLGFALGFVAYIALSTLGMMVGYLRRQTERFRGADVRLGRRFLVTTAALSGVILLMSTALFVIFPRLPRQWNVQGRSRGGEPMAGFSDGVRLGQHGGRIVSNPEIVFRVEFPDGAPSEYEMGRMHWRGRAFDAFDGEQWTRSSRIPAASPTASGYAERWGGPLRRTQIFGGPPGAPVLFGAHPVVSVQARSAIRPFREPSGDVLYFGSETPVYTVTSAAPFPPEPLLEDAPDQPYLRPYLRVPRLSERFTRLADSLSALGPTRLEKVRAVERYLTTQLSYTLDLPETRAEATLDGFLFRRRRGHCEYFSTAMAILLRAQGIPTRNVTGFLGGEWNDFGKYLAVTGNDAHSWVEVWFPKAGWVAFDPTPPNRDLAAEAEPGWSWPLRFWFDGLEHRWYKWVLDYNLDKQLALFRNVGDLFSRGPSGASGGAGSGAGRRAAPWALAIVGVVAFVWLVRGRKRSSVTPEARTYLALRRAYTRAGYARRGTETPLLLAESLERSGAPGAERARRVVDLYVRARFGQEAIGDAGRAEMAGALAQAREAIRDRRREERRAKRAGGQKPPRPMAVR